MSPCMCGADDCPECHPGCNNLIEVKCACGEAVAHGIHECNCGADICGSCDQCAECVKVMDDCSDHTHGQASKEYKEGWYEAYLFFKTVYDLEV